MIDKFDGEYRWLSNFYPCTIHFDGQTYKSVEHAYQAAKTLDKDARVAFHSTYCTASKAKAMGKTLALRPDWQQVRDAFMFDFVRQKFEQDPVLGTLLVLTGEEELVEGN